MARRPASTQKSSKGPGGGGRRRLLNRAEQLRASSGVEVPREEVQHGAGENVVAIAGDHVSRAADIGELDLREAREKLVGALLADEIAHLAPNQQHGHAAAQDRVNGGV